ncbi:phage tail spike protein [Clostridium baratii]
MIEVYNADNKEFEMNGDITLDPISAIFKIELNGICEVEVEHHYDSIGRWKYLKEDAVVSGPTPWSSKQLFRIYDTEKTLTGIKVYARHVFFDLVKYNIISNLHIKNKNGQEALDKILERTPYIPHSDIVDTNDCYFFKNNVIQGISGSQENTFLKRWGGEIFLDNFDVYINSRIGGDYGVKVSYANNMENLSLKRNIEGVFTRLHPYVTKNTSDTIDLPEDFVDSENIDKYSQVYEQYIDLSEYMHLKDGEDDIENAYETEEELYEAMRNKCKELFREGLDKPKVSGSVNMILLENTIEYEHVKGLINVGLGDDIVVEHLDIGVETTTRCVGYTWDMVNEKYLDINLGEIENDYFDIQSNTTGNLNNILNPNGSIDPSNLEGAINAIKSPLVAQKDIAAKSDVIAWKTEVTDSNDPNFGCMISGTKGILISDRRTPDGRDWVYDLAISARGMIADLLIGKIVAGSGAYFDLNHGEIYFNKGLIRGKNSEWNLETGEIKSRLQDGSELIISPTKGFYNKFGNSERAYHHLSYTEFVTCPINQGELSIKLPNEFKGKDFMVLVSPVSAVVDSFKPTEALRNVGVAVSVDYKNAIIKPASNYEYIDIETKKTRKVKCWADILVVA